MERHAYALIESFSRARIPGIPYDIDRRAEDLRVRVLAMGAGLRTKLETSLASRASGEAPIEVHIFPIPPAPALAAIYREMHGRDLDPRRMVALAEHPALYRFAIVIPPGGTPRLSLWRPISRADTDPLERPPFVGNIPSHRAVDLLQKLAHTCGSSVFTVRGTTEESPLAHAMVAYLRYETVQKERIVITD